MEVIMKYVSPSNQCHAPQGQRWLADKEDGLELWLQTSDNETEPKWRRYGAVIEEQMINNIERYREQENIL